MEKKKKNLIKKIKTCFYELEFKHTGCELALKIFEKNSYCYHEHCCKDVEKRYDGKMKCPSNASQEVKKNLFSCLW